MFQKEEDAYLDKPFKLHIRQAWWVEKPTDKKGARYIPLPTGVALVQEEWETLILNMANVLIDTLPEYLEPYQKEFLLKYAKRIGEQAPSFEDLEKRLDQFCEGKAWFRSLCDEAKDAHAKMPTLTEAEIFMNHHQDALNYIGGAYVLERQFRQIRDARPEAKRIYNKPNTPPPTPPLSPGNTPPPSPPAVNGEDSGGAKRPATSEEGEINDEGPPTKKHPKKNDSLKKLYAQL